MDHGVELPFLRNLLTAIMRSVNNVYCLHFNELYITLEMTDLLKRSNKPHVY